MEILQKHPRCDSVLYFCINKNKLSGQYLDKGERDRNKNYNTGYSYFTFFAKY
jgi:hypothetical protein